MIIYHHLGLGDHIICNGLVRSIVGRSDYSGYRLVVKRQNESSVRFMYRDLPQLGFEVVGDDAEANKILERGPCIKLGFEMPPLGYEWDEVFYLQAGVNFSNRWDSFYVERDFIAEEELYKKLNPNGEEYALIHRAGSDEVDRILYDAIDPSLKRIYVEKISDVVFDYWKLVEGAKEIHCVSSSFKDFVDSVKVGAKVFFHNVPMRQNSNHRRKLNWIMIS